MLNKDVIPKITLTVYKINAEARGLSGVNPDWYIHPGEVMRLDPQI